MTLYRIKTETLAAKNTDSTKPTNQDVTPYGLRCWKIETLI
jgi:hypothetical protein